ncbi:hypothetical protein LT493_16885 [Streptomyces tricolor]|nr:hypothetical protein [Streptomyces tricolor]
MPGGKGTLIGGDGYMISKKATPAQIRADLKWLNRCSSPRARASSATTRARKHDAPVGLPELAPVHRRRRRRRPEGQEGQRQRPGGELPGVPRRQPEAPAEDRTAARPADLLRPRRHRLPAVLTKKDADIDQLLKEASGKIDSILARS